MRTSRAQGLTEYTTAHYNTRTYASMLANAQEGAEKTPSPVNFLLLIGATLVLVLIIASDILLLFQVPMLGSFSFPCIR